MKLRNFQYRYLNRIVPTHKFLSKCQIVSSFLCDFCNMEIGTMHHLFGSVDMCNSFGQNLEIFLKQMGVIYQYLN